MFSHVMVGSNDRRTVEKLLRQAVRQGRAGADDKGRLAYGRKGAVFMVSQPIDGQPAATPTAAPSASASIRPKKSTPGTRRGVEAGGTPIEDPPGWRENAFGKLYLAYLRDPDGNKLCGLHRPPQ